MAGRKKPFGEEKPFWSISRDEQRLLWITFLGGFGSIIAGAVFIGAAIGVARAVQHGRPDLAALAIATLVTLGALIAVGIGGLLVIIRFGSNYYPTHAWLPYFIFAVIGVATLGCVLLCMIWVGVAAGVK